MRSPICHQLPPLPKEIATPVGGFDHVADTVGEGSLRHLTRKVRALSGPIAERATKAVLGLAATQPLQYRA